MTTNKNETTQDDGKVSAGDLVTWVDPMNGIQSSIIMFVSDHRPIDGPTKNNAIAYLANGDWQFVHHLTKTTPEIYNGKD